MLSAVKTVAIGDSYFSKDVSSILFEKINETSVNKKLQHRDEVPITDREIEVLRLIAEELTNQEIAEKLYISPRTVDTHRRNLLQKLNVKNTAGLIKYAMKNRLLE